MKLTTHAATVTYHLTEVPVLYETTEGLKKLLPCATVGYLEDGLGYFIRVPNGTMLPNEKEFEAVVNGAVGEVKKKEENHEKKWNTMKQTPIELPENEKEIAMVECMADFVAKANDNAKKKDFSLAVANMSDYEDLVKVYNLLRENNPNAAFTAIRHLDTFVRESIPDKVYMWAAEEADA